MTDKQSQCRAQIFCFPEGREFDVEVKREDNPKGYCWVVTEGLVDTSRFTTSPAMAQCPTCGNYVEVEAITEDTSDGT